MVRRRPRQLPKSGGARRERKRETGIPDDQKGLSYAPNAKQDCFRVFENWPKKSHFKIILQHCERIELKKKTGIQFWQNFNFLGKTKLLKWRTAIFSRIFQPNFFRQFFSSNQSCQQLKIATFKMFLHYFRQFLPSNQSCQQQKRAKPQYFHDFFNQKWDFLTDFQTLQSMKMTHEK